MPGLRKYVKTPPPLNKYRRLPGINFYKWNICFKVNKVVYLFIQMKLKTSLTAWLFVYAFQEIFLLIIALGLKLFSCGIACQPWPHFLSLHGFSDIKNVRFNLQIPVDSMWINACKPNNTTYWIMLLEQLGVWNQLYNKINYYFFRKAKNTSLIKNLK